AVTMLLSRTLVKCPRSPHLNSVGGSRAVSPVAVLVVVSQESGKSTVSTARSWVFGNPAQGCEHPSANVNTVAGKDVKIDIGNHILGSQSFKSAHVDARALEHRAVS